MSLERAFPKSKWDSPFSRAVLQEEQNASDYTIYHRDESGKPDFQYKPKHGMTTCVVKSIKICQAILKHSKPSGGLANLAKIYFNYRGHSTDPRRMKEYADTFLEMVQTRFPIVFVDDSLKNPDNWGVHWRNPFTGDFKTSDQSICLNGTVSQKRNSFRYIDFDQANVTPDYQPYARRRNRCQWKHREKPWKRRRKRVPGFLIPGRLHSHSRNSPCVHHISIPRSRVDTSRDENPSGRELDSAQD